MDANLIRLSDLSRRYARYGQSLPGLSLALGGLVILMYAVAPTLLIIHVHVCRQNIEALLAICVALLLSAWVLIKEWLREQVYQSLGLSESRASTARTLFIRILAVGIGAMSLSFPVVMLAVTPHPDPAPSPTQVYIGLTACFALPWATLRFIRGVQEGLMWFALCFWGLALAWFFPLEAVPRLGHGPIAIALVLSLPLTYFGGLFMGLLQHFEFMRLARDIRAQGSRDE